VSTKMDASQEVHDAARSVTQAASGGLAETRNAFVAKFIGWPFACAPGVVVDAEGNRTDEMSCAVHTTPAYTDGPNAGAFPADGVEHARQGRRWRLDRQEGRGRGVAVAARRAEARRRGQDHERATVMQTQQHAAEVGGRNW
jgi:hypothetical protein